MKIISHRGNLNGPNEELENRLDTVEKAIESGFDVQKLFHVMKPINPEYGNKNPTLSSNSWGYRANKSPTSPPWYYHFRGGSATSYTVNHALNTRDVIVQCYDASDYKTVYACVVRTDANNVTVTTATAAASNDLIVLVTKVD